MEENVAAMTELPTVSILMVNYNGQVHLEEFFKSVYDLSYPKDKYEVVVVDNASKDGSPDWIEKNYPQVKLVRLDENTGFAKGNNIGVEHCQGKFVALINSDVSLTRDWLIELVKPAIKEPEALFSSRILFYNNREYIGWGPCNLDSWGEGSPIQVFEKDNVKQHKPFEIMFASGCSLLLSKDSFIKLGGFEESYFCYAEDWELSWRAWLIGHKIYYVPSSKVYHKNNSTLGNRSNTLVYLCYRNQLRNIIKFPEFHNLIIMLPLFFAYYLALYIVAFSLHEKKYSLIFPILKGDFETLGTFPSLLRARRKIQKERVVKDKELKKFGIIHSFKQGFENYFATNKRKKKFLSDYGTGI